jgi:hypothetical protein
MFTPGTTRRPTPGDDNDACGVSVPARMRFFTVPELAEIRSAFRQRIKTEP